MKMWDAGSFIAIACGSCDTEDDFVVDKFNFVSCTCVCFVPDVLSEWGWDNV